MKKIDPVIKKETGFVALVSLILSIFMQSVFLIVSYWLEGAWDYSVILGNLLGYIFCVLNFFLMCMTIQKALGKEQKDAANYIKLSQMLRMLMLFVVALVAYLIDNKFGCFNIIALVIPYFFPRIAVIIRSSIINAKQRRNSQNE